MSKKSEKELIAKIKQPLKELDKQYNMQDKICNDIENQIMSLQKEYDKQNEILCKIGEKIDTIDSKVAQVKRYGTVIGKNDRLFKVWDDEGQAAFLLVKPKTDWYNKSKKQLAKLVAETFDNKGQEYTGNIIVDETYEHHYA
jgi:uncharacterized coiled-coil protein SlyX